MSKETDCQTKATKQDSRENILKVARHLISLRGYKGVSIRDMAVDGRWGAALVKYYFKHKEGLYQSLCMEYAEPVRERRLALLNNLPAQPDLKSFLYAYLSICLDMCRYPDLGGTDYARLMSRLPLENKELTAEFRSEMIEPVFESYFKVLHQILGTQSNDDAIWINHMMESLYYSLISRLTSIQLPLDFTRSATGEDLLRMSCEAAESMLLVTARSKD